MVGNTVKTVIEKVVAGGDGLARLPDGRVLFVPFSLAGEELAVNIHTEKSDYAIGKIEELITPSPARIEPECRHFGSCGGCQLQHVSYDEEIKIKQTYLQETLLRQTGLDLAPEALYPSPKEWGYRRKSEHPVASSGKGKLHLGYYKRRTHNVVDIGECPVLEQALLSDLCKLRELLAETAEPVYNEKTGYGNLRHVVMRGSSTGDRMIGLVTSGKYLVGDTIVRLMADFSSLNGIVQNINPARGNRILGERTEIITGSDHISERIEDIELKVSFTSFFQANHAQAERIVKVVREFLSPASDDVLVDAYAGVGMIGLALAADVKEVVAIESEAAAVRDGKRNTEQNSLENVNWVEGETGKVLGDIRSNMLILDPPRKGLTDDVISACLKVKPGKLCYVSCNPATWARDIGPLVSAGYSLKRLAMIDMFPRTAHLELVSLLEAA